MLKLRTKTPFEFSDKRTKRTGIIRMIIDGLSMDKNNITPKGYYYYFDENNQPVVLDRISEKPVLREEVYAAESSTLDPLQSTAHTFDVIDQRLAEFTFIRLAMENGTNYGTLSTDWEIDTE